MLKRKAPKPRPKPPDENPEWSAADFAKAVHVNSATLAEAVKAARRGRGPQAQPKKVAISIRLKPEIVARFKAGGAGWQSRIEAALEKASGVRKG